MFSYFYFSLCHVRYKKAICLSVNTWTGLDKLELLLKQETRILTYNRGIKVYNVHLQYALCNTDWN